MEHVTRINGVDARYAVPDHLTREPICDILESSDGGIMQGEGDEAMTAHRKEGSPFAGEHYEKRPWTIERGDKLWDVEYGEACLVVEVEAGGIQLAYADGLQVWIPLSLLWDEYQVLRVSGEEE